MPAGERVAGAYQTLDVGPTLLALAGLDPGLGEGRSLLPDADGTRRAREETFAEVYPDYFRLVRLSVPVQRGMGDFRWPMRAIRRAGEKLVVWDGGPTRLYDLAADPPEERDRASERGDRARVLRERLDAWSAARPALRAGAEGEGGTAPLDDETRRQLEALGYL
jgi:arylsulfatase A-like enzyme